MRVVIAGGGTGGHLFPGVALAREFERRGADVRIQFVGTARGLETRIIPREGFELRLIPAGGLVGLGGFRKLKTLFLLPFGLWRSWKILREFRPALVIGVGGYASGPVVAMAGLLGLPRVLVEPNAIPGLTNRWLGRWADRIYLSFEEARRGFKPRSVSDAIRVFGNPIRRDIVSSAGRSGEMRSTRTVLVMGGSQGSRAINRVMAEALTGLRAWRTTLRIIHQSGDQDAAWLRGRYSELGFDAEVAPFLSPVAEAYRRADLVVCRSGATTTAELTACGLPAVLIPFPHATHGHQEKNARALLEAGAAEMILERDLTAERLSGTIAAILKDPERLRTMAENSRRLGRPEAAEKIVDDCLKLIGA